MNPANRGSRPMASHTANAPVAATYRASNSSSDHDSGADRFLTNADAARFLNLSPRTLEKLRVTGGGPRFRKLRRRVLYAVSDLRSWADQRICESTSDVNYLRR
jgi:hypothetical protein